MGGDVERLEHEAHAKAARAIAEMAPERCETEPEVIYTFDLSNRVYAAIHDGLLDVMDPYPLRFSACLDGCETTASDAATVILVGPDLKEELPVLHLRLRDAVLNAGVLRDGLLLKVDKETKKVARKSAAAKKSPQKRVVAKKKAPAKKKTPGKRKAAGRK